MYTHKLRSSKTAVTLKILNEVLFPSLHTVALISSQTWILQNHTPFGAWWKYASLIVLRST